MWCDHHELEQETWLVFVCLVELSRRCDFSWKREVQGICFRWIGFPSCCKFVAHDCMARDRHWMMSVMWCLAAESFFSMGRFPVNYCLQWIKTWKANHIYSYRGKPCNKLVGELTQIGERPLSIGKVSGSIPEVLNLKIFGMLDLVTTNVPYKSELEQ